jgi:hypothetical protein
MAFRIDDLSVQLMPSNGGQPGGCTCGPASGNAPAPCMASGKPGGGRPGGPKRHVLTELRTQLRENLASPGLRG